jgi:predicted metal-binding membrane protein
VSGSDVLFLGAGVYQFTPLKRACLRRCRSPLEFLAEHWREGNAGAFRMGLRHGAYCIGCCWAVMALLVPVEKLLPGGPVVGRVLGAGLIAWGAAGLAAAAMA